MHMEEKGLINRLEAALDVQMHACACVFTSMYKSRTFKINS